MSITLNFGLTASTGGIVTTPVPQVQAVLGQAVGGMTATHITGTANNTIAAASGSLVAFVNGIGAAGNLQVMESTFTNTLFSLAPGDYGVMRVGTAANIYCKGVSGVNAMVYVMSI